MSTHKNPFRAESDFGKIFSVWQKKGIATRTGLIKGGAEATGKTEKNIGYKVTSLLSPRETSKRGDCRGNIAVKGHLYFAKRLNRKFDKTIGKNLPMEFRLMWRKTALAPRMPEYVAAKAEKAPVKAKVEVKSEVKSEATA